MSINHDYHPKTFAYDALMNRLNELNLNERFCGKDLIMMIECLLNGKVLWLEDTK